MVHEAYGSIHSALTYWPFFYLSYAIPVIGIRCMQMQGNLKVL